MPLTLNTLLTVAVLVGGLGAGAATRRMRSRDGFWTLP
jgi:hypothetical protein